MTALAELADRVVPVLVFLVAITVVAEICDLAGVFDEAAHLAARAARGRVVVLWLLVVVLACACTILLSLDTTAVLLTPVALTVSTQVGVPPLAFAMTTLWLANTASLLLPVSNLTNLLALHHFSMLGLSVPEYVALLWPPSLTAIVLTVGVLWALHRKQLRGRYDHPPRAEPHDRPLMVVSTVVAALLAPAFVSGITPAWPAIAAALVLLAATALRAPTLLQRIAVPWKAALGVAALFVVVDLALRRGAWSVADRRRRHRYVGGRPAAAQLHRGRLGQRDQQLACLPRPRGHRRPLTGAASRPARRRQRRTAGDGLGLARDDPLGTALPGRRDRGLLGPHRRYRHAVRARRRHRCDRRARAHRLIRPRLEHAPGGHTAYVEH